MNYKTALLVSSLLGGAAASCGYSNPGDGSHSLEVHATLTYRVADTDQTAVRITVTKNGVAVPSANVVVTDADNNKTYTISDKADASTYQQDIAGFHRRVAIKVESGTDNITCQIEGPGRHVVSAPLQGPLKRANDLGVEWTTRDGVRADEVTVALDLAESTQTVTDDRGTFTVASPVLKTGLEKLHVTRRNKLVPAGGVGSSSVEMNYEVAVEFQIE